MNVRARSAGSPLGTRWHPLSIVAGLALAAAMPATPAHADAARAVAGGMVHTCALTTTGGIKCWGYNSYGQLGNPAVSYSSETPVDVVGLSSGVVAIGAGWHHTCAVTRAGALKCWGRNDYGQLGDGTTVNRSSPVNVQGLSAGVTAVSAGFTHTCALMASGAVKCWGANYAGQVGDGTFIDRLTAVDVTGLSDVLSITTGSEHNCALVSGGGVKCWGYNSSGGLGDGTTVWSSYPVDVLGLSSGVGAISAGYEHSCAVTTSGGALCWGHNSDGQVGDGTDLNRLTPVGVTGLSTNVTAVGAGYYHTCAVTASGAVRCWGNNYYGQLGDGTTTDSWTPVQVSGLSSGVAAVAAGIGHTCARTPGGAVVCWGYNGTGQLGDGTYMSRTTPVAVLGLDGTNPAPVLTGLVPAAVRAGTGAFTLAVNGTQFLDGSAVRWNGEDRPTTFVSATRLTAAIPASDLESAGTVAVTVFTPAPGGGTSRAVSFRVTSSDAPPDNDGDGIADLTVWRPRDGTWYVKQSVSGFTTSQQVQWGSSSDKPFPGDYDGDGLVDLAVWRPGNGTWYIRKSSTSFTTSQQVQWGRGALNDTPVPADYDGDGRLDLAVWRPGNGTWYIKESSSEYVTWQQVRWGSGASDRPVPGDYDGDGRADLAVWRPSTGVWYILKSSTGYAASQQVRWGSAAMNDRPVPADYDGDGLADPAVWRPATGTWFVKESSTGYTTSQQVQWGWGAANDVPVYVMCPIARRQTRVSFDGLLVDAEPVSSYTESGITVEATEGDWQAWTGYGHPAPFVAFGVAGGEPPTTGEVTLTAGGSEFGFVSVDLYSSTTPVPYTITGRLGATTIFTLSGTVPNPEGDFATVPNPQLSARIDTLVISLVNAPAPCCDNRVGLDSVRLIR